MPTASKEIVVSNKLGLHARPAMQFVDVANQFQSSVMVYKGGEEPGEADGKSVMQMIILAATEGTPLRIEANGDKVTSWLNGKQMVHLEDAKIGDGEGSIALQIHDGGGIKVRWKNIKIRELK